MCHLHQGGDFGRGMTFSMPLTWQGRRPLNFPWLRIQSFILIASRTFRHHPNPTQKIVSECLSAAHEHCHISWAENNCLRLGDWGSLKKWRWKNSIWQRKKASVVMVCLAHRENQHPKPRTLPWREVVPKPFVDVPWSQPRTFQTHATNIEQKSYRRSIMG